MIRITQRAASSSWLSLAYVQSRLEDTDLTSEELEVLVAMASAALDVELGRPAALQGYVVHAVGQTLRNEWLYLPRFPIEPTSLSIKIRGTTVTDWTLADPSEGLVYRPGGWPTGAPYDASSVPLIEATIGRAGYLVPDQIIDWAADTAVVEGKWARPATPARSPLLFLCTASGTTGSSEPTWATAAEAEVTDGGATLTVESVEPQTGPLDILLIVDASLVGQAVRPYLPAMVDALGEGEQMGLVSYDQSATLLQDFTSSRDLLRRGLEGLRYGNNPRVLDALYAALDGGFEAATARRAVIVVSAGVEGRSETGVSDVVRLARDRRATLHFVYEEGVDSRLFERVARSAAGSWFHAKKLKLDPKALAAKVFAAVRSTYVLEVSGVFTLSDELAVEVVGAPAGYKKPVASVLSFE